MYGQHETAYTSLLLLITFSACFFSYNCSRRQCRVLISTVSALSVDKITLIIKLRKQLILVDHGRQQNRCKHMIIVSRPLCPEAVM